MKDRIVRVSIAKTVQERQYEPLRVSVSAEATLSDNEDFNSVAQELRAECREQVDQEINTWIE